MRKTALGLIALIATSQLNAQQTVGKVVNTLKERINLSGYAQVGYTYNDAQGPDNTFDVKRIIVMADGKITEQWSCYFMYDFAAGGNLLEVYTDYTFVPQLSARLGQFKTPYTIESLLSPSTVELINCYSAPVSYLAAINGSDKLAGANGGRDIGLMLYGDLFENKLLSYKLALMNGQGINTKDKNNQKDVVGYLMVNPTKWIAVGASFIKGTGHALADNATGEIKAGNNYVRNRWSAGAVFTTSKATLRTEYMAGNDGGIHSNGFYATGSAQLCPKLEVIASFDYLDRNTAVAEKQSNYIAGLQYWFYPKCRVQAQYTRQEPRMGEGANLVQAQIQVRF